MLQELFDDPEYQEAIAMAKKLIRKRQIKEQKKLQKERDEMAILESFRKRLNRIEAQRKSKDKKFIREDF